MRQLIFHISLLCAALSMSAAVPEQSILLPGIDLPTVKERLSISDLQPIEGVWCYPNEEMTIAIEKFNGEGNIRYRIFLVESPDLELMPGTVIGYIAPSPVSNKFQMWLFSERNHDILNHPLECVATLSTDHSSITFDPPHWKLKVRVNFSRFLPTLFRGISVIPEKKEEKLPIGFNKLFPTDGNGEPFTSIRYL